MASIALLGPGTPEPLGASLDGAGLNLAVVARNASRVVACFYDEAGAEAGRVALDARTGDVHHGRIAGVGEGARYALRVDGPDAIADGHRYDPAKLVIDPWATRIDRPFAMRPELAAPRSSALDSAPWMPRAIVEPRREPAPPLASPPATERRVIYEINPRGHTRLHPAVPEEDRGTLAGLAHPAVIADMLALGVTTVELMPIAAFVDERHLPTLGLSNAWGYNPVLFMAPDPRIAPGGMDEVRACLAALHDAGLEVILDVVFNHTGESDALGPTLSLRGIDHALYYRLDPDDPTHPANDTGCGNTLALHRAAPQRLVLDALRHWADAGFDGFRFDLATVLGRHEQGFDPDASLFAAIAQDPLLRTRLMVAEPWDVGPGGYQLGRFGAVWDEWNDRFRHDVRRFWKGDGSRGALATRLAGSADIFGTDRGPSTSINFVAAHDGFSLADLVAYARKHNEANGEDNRDGDSSPDSWNHGIEGPTDRADIVDARARDVRALLATLFVARGTPLITAGDEFGRSQGGNNNAYAQDNATTWLDWDRADRELAGFVAGLIRLRAEHPALHADRFLTGAVEAATGLADVEWLGPGGHRLADWEWEAHDRHFLGMCLTAPAGIPGVPGVPGVDDRVLVYLNAGPAPRRVHLPAARHGHAWRLELDSAAGVTMFDVALDGVCDIAARAVVLITERTLPRGQRPAELDNRALDRLARAAGIARDWWSVDGTRTEVTPATTRALLASLGLPVETAADIRDHVARIERERHARLLPLTTILPLGEPARLDLTVPLTHLERRRRFELVLDDGATATFDAAPSALAPTGETRLGSQRFARVGVDLGPLPIGRHLLRDLDSGEVGHLLVAPPHCHLPADLAGERRATGISAQLYALRSTPDHGIGDLGTLAAFAEAAGRDGHAVVGVNPLHALFSTDRSRASPYHPSDRGFIEPLSIDLAAAADLVDHRAALAEVSPVTLDALRAAKYVDYPAVWAFKDRVLAGLFEAFEAREGADLLRFEFQDFVAEGGEALRRFALFEAFARRAGTTDRSCWPEAWRDVETAIAAGHDPETAHRARRVLFEQWLADRQLAGAAARARSSGLSIGLYRDLAVGSAPDGAEGWRAPGAFARNVSVGAPPDPFSATGQVWNIPPLDPLELLRSGGAAFAALVEANMRHAGALRIDHAMGLARLFFVPAGASAADGGYVAMPADLMFAVLAIESAKTGALVVGEDLGTVPEGFAERMAASGVLSTRVMLFERDGVDFRPFWRYPRNSVACVASHDLPTLVGWRRGRDIDIDVDLGRLDPAAAAGRRARRGDELAALARVLAEAGTSPVDDGDAALVAATSTFLRRTPAMLTLTQAEDLALEPDPVNVPGTDREYPNWRRRLPPAD